MARIRSIHPGFFTDEEMVSVSAFARLLFLGLLTESDDGGVFEWKPVSLKMRIFPADNVDLPALLEELIQAGRVTRYSVEGRQYGAVRNFCKYQRPKKPKLVHVRTPEVETWTASNASGGEPDDDDGPPVPKKSELAPQMEDGGGRREDGKKNPHSALPVRASAEPATEPAALGLTAGSGEGQERTPPTPPPKPPRGPNEVGQIVVAFDEAQERVFGARKRQLPNGKDHTHARRLLDLGLKPQDAADLFEAILKPMAARGRDAPRALSYVEGAVADHLAELRRPLPTAVREAGAAEVYDPQNWRLKIAAFKEGGQWLRMYGPKPGEKGCAAPAALLEAFGYTVGAADGQAA